MISYRVAMPFDRLGRRLRGKQSVADGAAQLRSTALSCVLPADDVAVDVVGELLQVPRARFYLGHDQLARNADFREFCADSGTRPVSPVLRIFASDCSGEAQRLMSLSGSSATRVSSSSRVPSLSRSPGGWGGRASADRSPWWMSASTAKKMWSRPA